jgi:hypothetical protein
MTIDVSVETANMAPTGPETTTGPTIEDLIPVDGFATWQATFADGLSGTAQADEMAIRVTITGVGNLKLSPETPVTLPQGSQVVQLLVDLPTSEAEADAEAEASLSRELVILLSGGAEVVAGPLDFHGTHLLRAQLPAGATLAGIEMRGLFAREAIEVTARALSFERSMPLADVDVANSPYGPVPSMQPACDEEVTTSVSKDGISFVLESRSLSAVVRYVYTPIDGNLSDIEIEINNADAIKLSEGGGVTIDMDGQEWSPDDDEIERHFVSCELVGEQIEARWQWRRGSELADFLYRIAVSGKSLLVEIEGGSGRAAGVELGYVVGAIHPRMIRLPYFNLGDAQPQILSTSGVFISGYLDWFASRASSLHGAPRQPDELMHLNGGCRYQAASDGRRRNLKERWVLTVSRRFEEVLPTLPEPTTALPAVADSQRIYCELPEMEAGEEAYIEAYERLRMFRQLGMDDLVVLHPDSTWDDGHGGTPALEPQGAPAKGGDDAFREYLDAIGDLKIPFALSHGFRDISCLDSCWGTSHAGIDAQGGLISTGPGRFQLKPRSIAALAAASLRYVQEQYSPNTIYLRHMAAEPPWTRVDSDARLGDEASSYLHTLQAEQALLATLRDEADTHVVADGGHHWMHRGLLQAVIARIGGESPSTQPLIVDFPLRHMDRQQVSIGLGSPEDFLGADLPEEARDSRSPAFDRYLATTVAFGNAGLVPDLVRWGLPAVAKVYYMLRHLQTFYLGVQVESIHYQRGGNLLETTEALVAGAHELSQVRVIYANGLHIYINGAAEESWEVSLDEETTYVLPPASFLAHGPDGLLVYSADAGQGRIDFVKCDDYLYCDTRGERLNVGPITVRGAAVVTTHNWQIDVYPIDTTEPIELEPAAIWPDRRLPPLRVLAFRDDKDEPDVESASVSRSTITLRPQDDVYRYRITLPEWMVEPGK